MRKWIIISVFLSLTAMIGYNYMYQDHREIATETAEFEIHSNDLANSFLINTKSAEAKYLNTTIIIFGSISDITNNSITLDDKILCLFKNDLETNWKKKKNINIKGRVIGYDDLLEQVKIDQCIIQ